MNASDDTARKGSLFHKSTFLIYLLLISGVFLFMLRPFLMAVFLGAIFCGLTYPLYRYMLRKVKKPVFASLLTLLSLLLVLVLPLAAVGSMAYQEAVGFFASLDINTLRSRLEGLLQALRGRFPDLLHQVNAQDLSGMTLDALQNGGQFLLKHSADISLSVAGNLVSFFLMLFIMFYFYIDGPRILQRAITWSPLEDKYELVLIEKFVSVSKGTLKGIMVVGLLQGLIGGILLASVGFHSPIFLGVLMVFSSIIPALGTALVWGPSALFLLAEGRWVAAMIVVLVGIFVISSVDNLVRPKIVGKDIQMHDLMVLLSTLGGLTLFGLPGLIIGPILASLFLSVWTIFEEVFAEEIALNKDPN